MIPRYQRPEMAALWSLENQYEIWLKIELAVLKAQSDFNIVSKKDYQNIKEKAKIDVPRILAIEEEVKHDVIAFVSSVEELAGDSARFLHYGLTSSDVVDTAFSLNLAKAGIIILEQLKLLSNVLKNMAEKYKQTLIIGRSHGIHGEPTSFGLKILVFYSEFKRHETRMARAIEIISVGQLSGPMGNFSSSAISPEIEEAALKTLGLKAVAISNQIIQRDRHAEYFSVLAQIASSLEKLAVEIRHLSRTEVKEVEEAFAKNQKGSSAMPHKKNPILTENITGLARVVRANSLAALENVPLWHERDISHSSVERIIGPDSTTLVDFMLHRMVTLMENLVVHPQAMLKNLQQTGGLYNSQEILLALCAKGLKRDVAYRLVQKEALKSYEENLDFKSLILKNKEITKLLTAEEIEEIFNLNRFLNKADKIYERVFKN